MDDESKLIDMARREIDAIPRTTPTTMAEIKGYRLLSEIHRGAQGVVYRAVQESTGQSVAVKVMREGPHAGEVDRARFDREVKVLAQLQHPNIVSILDTGSSSGSFYFVMDYIHGQPLDVFTAGAEHSIPDTLALFADICSAIQAAHVRGVIHRDIKPGNILIDEDGQPHILDFGLAKVEEEDAPMMTMTGQFVGSIPWSSPEQADAPSLVDVRSDVYALGVILFQMLTGRFPYDVTGNLRDVLERIGSATPIRPRSLRSDIDDEVETMMLMCLAKDPDRRYQTSGELARDVESYLAGDPIQAKRDSTWYLLGKHFQRHRISMAVAAAFLLVITAGFLVSFTFWQKAEHHRAIAESARQEAVDARLVAENQAATAETVSGYFEELLQSAAPSDPEGVRLASLGNDPAPTIVEILERASHDLPFGLKSSPEAEARIRSAMGAALVRYGRFDEARSELEFAWNLRRENLGDLHPETLRTAGLLGATFVYSGENAEAEAFLSPIVLDFQSVLGEEHPDTLLVQSQLGHVLAAQGQTEEGVRMLLKVKESLDSHLEGEIEELLEISLEPAFWLNSAGETEAAADLARRHHKASVRLYGADHVSTRSSDRVFTRFVTRHSVEGTSPGGLERALDREVHGNRQVFVMSSDSENQNEFEMVTWPSATNGEDAGQPEALAVAAHQSVMRMQQRLGAEHPRTLSAKGRLAWEMRSVPALLPTAEDLARETYECTLRIKGENDIDTLLNQQTLGVIKHLQGESEQADELLGDLLLRARAHIPSENGVLFLFQWTHSAALREVERDGRAQEVLREGCEGMLSTIGIENDKTRRALIELASLSDLLQRKGDAHWAREQLAPRPRQTLDADS